MNKLISTNPGNDYKVNDEIDISDDEEINEKVQLANSVKKQWKELGTQKRVELMKPIYEEIIARKTEFAELITKEIGKPISASNGETNSFTEEIKWFMENVESSLADEITHEDSESKHKIVYEPFGTAAVITPWNYPLGMAIWGIFPNLLVGNTVVFKISEECPLVGKLLEEIINSHNLPKGVFSEIYGDGNVGQKLVENEVDLIWFTGSSKVGKLMYKIAADKFIKVVLEMGGSNPGIVFEDVEINKVVPRIYSERFANCGQSCDALKRLMVHESIFDKLVEELKKEIENKVVGDPNNKKTEIGSLVAERQVILLEDQFNDAVDKGAKVIIGGKKPEGLKGAFFEPTLLTNITKDMKVWKEEVFGPVLPVVSFKTEDEAIELANDTKYGLGSRIFTNDKEKAARVALKIDAGTVEINQGSRWLPCNPFGGYKESGMGREHGVAGFRELCQIKVISEE